MISFSSTTVARWAVLALVAVTSAACTMDKTKAPALSGPSEFGMSLDISATPDRLNRDGSSQATIQVVTRGPNGKAWPQPLTLRLSLDPVDGGTLSADEVQIDGNGIARVVYTAPAASQALQRVRVAVVPVGGNYDNARIQSIAIGLVGSAAPLADFEVLKPTDPRQFDLLTFDASKTTLNGNFCDLLCTYTWTFGTEGSATGQVVSHRFEAQGAHTVTLTVGGPDGVSVTVRKTVIIAEAPKPEATIVVSTAAPRPGQEVRFSGITSVGRGGASIVGYAWDFGNGETASGPIASTTFEEGTYLVVLTVTDSNGQTASATQVVTVTPPAP